MLIGLQGGSAVLVQLQQPQQTGITKLVYKDVDVQDASEYMFGAVFATGAQAVLLGAVEGCVLVWDRMKASIVYGLEHELGQYKFCDLTCTFSADIVTVHR